MRWAGWLPRGVFIFPDQGSHPVSPALADGFLTTGALEGSSCHCVDDRYKNCEHQRRKGTHYSLTGCRFSGRARPVFGVRGHKAAIEHQRSEVTLNSSEDSPVAWESCPTSGAEATRAASWWEHFRGCLMSCFWLSEDLHSVSERLLGLLSQGSPQTSLAFTSRNPTRVLW